MPATCRPPPSRSWSAASTSRSTCRSCWPSSSVSTASTASTFQLFDEPAGVDATTAMLAGQVDGVGGFYDHTIDIQAKGKDTESVVSMLQVPGEVELCRADLKGSVNSPADWKGRNLGITDPGSSTDFLTQYLGVKNGVQPSQTTRIGVQAGPTFIAAMQHKQIDCGMTTEPTISALVATGQAYVISTCVLPRVPRRPSVGPTRRPRCTCRRPTCSPTRRRSRGWSAHLSRP